MTSTVLLGLEDAAISLGQDRLCDMTVNKLGGLPNWPSASGPAADTYLMCARCRSRRTLVVQVYAPVSSCYHRTLYVMACVTPACASGGGSWICVRTQTPVQIAGSDETGQTAAPPVTLTAEDWLEGADDWGDDGTDECELPMELKALAVSESRDPAPDGVGSAGSLDAVSTVTVPRPMEPADCGCRLVFRPAYLAVVEEPTCSADLRSTGDHESRLMKEYEKREGVDFSRLGNILQPSADGDSETYEKSAPAHGDRLLHKLKRRLERCPSQLLRYSPHDGAPLPLARLPCPAPACTTCGADSRFELQLLPTLISCLKPLSDRPSPCVQPQGSGYGTVHAPSQPAVEVPEFGTVLVYTCRNSCWTDRGLHRQETVIVQMESAVAPPSHLVPSLRRVQDSSLRNNGVS